jgi:hypothetical protein
MIGFAFAIFRRLTPAKVDSTLAAIPREELRRRYQSWEIASILPIFAFAALFACGWFFLLRDGAKRLAPTAGEAPFVIAPEDAYWLLPAFFLGLVSSALPVALLYKWLLGDRYREYDAYNQLRTGVNTWAVFRVFAILICLAATGFVLAGVNYTTVFDERGITTQRMWGSAGGFHGYSAVTAIRREDYFTAPNGNRIYRPHYVIELEDGARWTSRDGLRTPEPFLDTKIMEFVARKSGRAIQSQR